MSVPSAAECASGGEGLGLAERPCAAVELGQEVGIPSQCETVQVSGIPGTPNMVLRPT